MLHSCISLLLQAFGLLVETMGTSSVAIIVAIGIFSVTQIVKLFRYHDLEAMKQRWKENVMDGFLITAMAWIALFGWSVVKAIYADHRSLVNANENLRQQLDALKQKDRRSSGSGGTPPVTTVRQSPEVSPTVAEEKRCWEYYDARLQPKPSVVGAATAAQVTIFCNKRIEAPLFILVDFDGDILDSDDFIPGMTMSMHNAGGMFRGGKRFLDRIASPAIPPYTPVFLIVQSKTQIHPTQWAIGTEQ